MPDEAPASSAKSSSSSDTNPATDQRAKLEAFEPSAVELLGVLALADTWLSRTRWGHAARNAGLACAPAVIERLVDAGLVLAEPMRSGSLQYRVAPAAILPTLELLHERERLVRLEGRSSRGWGLRDYGTEWVGADTLTTDLRIAAVRRDAKIVARVLDKAAERIDRQDFAGWLVYALGPAIPPAVVDLLGDAHSASYLRTLLASAYATLEPVPDPLIDAAQARTDPKLRLELGRLLILRGQPERARKLDKLPKHGAEGLALLAAFWSGDFQTAATVGDEAVAAMKSRKFKGLAGIEGVCHVLAKLVVGVSTGGPKSLDSLAPLFEAGLRGRLGEPAIWPILAVLQRGLLGERGDVQARAVRAMNQGSVWSLVWVSALHDLWLQADRKFANAVAGDAALAILDAWIERATSRRFAPVARELSAARDALAGVGATDDALSPNNLIMAMRPPEPWEAALAGLEATIDEAEAAAAPTPEPTQEQELQWVVSTSPWSVMIKAQVRSAKSRRWGERPLTRLVDDDELQLGPADRKVVTALRLQHALRYESSFDRGLGALEALIDHPRVVDPQGQPLRIDRGHARLVTERKDGRLRVTVEPNDLRTREACWLDEPGRVLVYRRPARLARAIEIIGRGLDLPERAGERLQRTLTRLSVTFGVALAGELRPAAQSIAADPRPVLLMQWDRQGLQIEARVAPLGLDGTQMLPGVGNPAVTAERVADGGTQLLACERDLADEARRLARINRECPTLACFALGARTWSLPGLADALEALLELGRLGDEVVLAWPAGKPLHPPIERELGDLRVALRSAGSWFELDAELPVDERLVLSLRKLIDAREGRFVALGEGRFLALSESLRRRLDALERLDSAGASKAKDGSLKISAAMLPVLGELTEDLATASFDDASQRSLARLRELTNAKPPRPRSFEARLRDYQAEGYAWMWRLAEAGLGACLADDMGLGKTVQTLALLCQRASKGPALVVCPTSVVHNWVAEAGRFAPSLRVHVLADAEDRAALIAGAKRRDVIVCSYGLLVSEAEQLAAVRFTTAVFDEAHALKNAKTARAKAARSLTAEFRLGLTGTPVENRVAELHSLFRVLVPGLLGTRAQFEARYAKPIARGEREAATSLRSVLRHFILRRTKSAVLDELPPRTEVTLMVPAPAEARAFYEALRRRAQEAVKRGKDRDKRVRVLAELTKLRQAAVDPRLLDDKAPPGAKIDALVEQIAELREQGHRALVFTQFLTSMALLRGAFAEAGVEILELDGSTSAAERARRVEAFQAGEADVFLISLKAGGVGLNLTGADYVFHVDPWWNPAVEDQATDRAHRIGQTRPVTVYRLIGEGTVEAKILELHARKRDLAGDILGGLDGGDGLELAELVALLDE